MQTNLQNLIDSGKSIKDDKFQASLGAEVARFAQTLPEIKALSDYNTHELPQKINDAYNKAQEKTNKPITDTIAEANTHIAQLEAALKPTIDKLNANQDANQTYASTKGQISSALDFLTGDKTKLDKFATTVADPQLKTMISNMQSSIDTEKARVTQIQQAVAQSAINDHIAKAEAIKASVNLATGDFRKAYMQYATDKRTTPNTPTTSVMQEYAKVYNLMQQVVPLLKTDLAAMSATDTRKNAVNGYIGPKTVGTSLAYVVQVAANLLIAQGIQVQQPS